MSASTPTKEELLPEAEAGNAEAQFQLGNLYDNSDDSSTPEDSKTALHWYEKAAAQRYPNAAEHAGYLILHGLAGKIEPDGKIDHARAMKWLLPAAEAGSGWASELIAMSYFRGKGVEADAAKAFPWWQRGAEKNRAECMFRCGYSYAKGLGTARDDAKAAEWFRKGAEAGNSSSCACMGALAWAGRGTDRDYAVAKQWFEKAMKCRGGNSWAPYMLGVMSENGQGMPRDMKQATAYYKQAAEGRYYQAKIRCNILHAARAAEVPEFAEDIKWIVQGAEKGNPLDQFVLGMAFLQGSQRHQMSQSDISAFIWLSLASDFHMAVAEETCNVLRKKLSAEDLHVAQGKIAEIRKKAAADPGGIPLF